MLILYQTRKASRWSFVQWSGLINHTVFVFQLFHYTSCLARGIWLEYLEHQARSQRALLYIDSLCPNRTTIVNQFNLFRCSRFHWSNVTGVHIFLSRRDFIQNKPKMKTESKTSMIISIQPLHIHTVLISNLAHGIMKKLGWIRSLKETANLM